LRSERISRGTGGFGIPYWTRSCGYQGSTKENGKHHKRKQEDLGGPSEGMERWAKQETDGARMEFT
jgi:hypothetical protein